MINYNINDWNNELNDNNNNEYIIMKWIYYEIIILMNR